jgi:DNA-binding CsgD family transcriptional regulator
VRDTEIVGRDVELRAISSFLEQSARPGALLIEGEAGIGKTTLWREAARAAAAAGYRVLGTRPSAAEAGFAFAGLGDLLAASLDEVRTDLPDPQMAALEIALLRRDAESRTADPRAVSAGVLGALAALATETSVMVAVDDVQWLDRQTAAALAYAFRRLDEHPVRLTASLRLDPALPSSELLETLEPELTTRVRVGPLSAGALHRAIRIHLDRTLPRPVLLRVHTLAAGNPFYALELARSLPDDPRAELALPPTLERAIHERLGRLAAPVRRLLEPVALLANPTAVVLEGLGDDPDTAGRNLDVAVAAGVIEIEADGIRFTHPLLAEGVASMIGPRRRRRLHRQLADLVSDPEERARHFALAADGPSADVADLLEASARLARARGAPSAAAELVEEAVRLTPASLPAEEFRRTIAAGGYHFEAGDAVRARRLLGDAARAAAPGPQRARANWRLARAHVFEADHRTAVRLYRQALAEAGEDAETRIEAEAGLAVAMMRMLDDLPAAARHARAAVDLAEAHSVGAPLPELKARQALIDGLLGDPDALELARNAAELENAADASGASEADSFARTLGGASFMRGVLLQWADRLEESRASFEWARRRVLELGDESSLPLIGRYVATNAWLEGDWETAGREADEGYEIAAQTGQSSQQGVLAGVKALVLAHLGRVDDSRAAVAEAAGTSKETGAMFGLLLASSAIGFLELSLGNPAEADRNLAPLLERLEAAGVREPGAMRFVPDEIEALILVDRRDEADAICARLEQRARRLDRPSALAAAYRCRGLLETAHGRHDDGLAVFHAALAQHHRVSMPFERARTLLALGTVQRRARMKRAARETLQQALGTFDELGAAIWAENARAELARIGGRRAGGSELTATEQRVAELVARGLTNQEVARELVVADRTVEGHLTRIYAKLGVRSRSELARRFASGPDS